MSNPTTGTVAKIDAATKSFSIQASPPPALPVAFAAPTDAEWQLVLAAWSGSKSITVDGDPPDVTNVRAP